MLVADYVSGDTMEEFEWWKGVGDWVWLKDILNYIGVRVLGPRGKKTKAKGDWMASLNYLVHMKHHLPLYSQKQEPMWNHLGGT